MDLTELKYITSDRHPWEVSRLKIIFDIFEKYYTSADCTVLDIGCGDIFVAEGFVHKFKVRNYIAVDTAFDKGIIEIFARRLEQKNNENIILCKDFLEMKKLTLSKVDYIFLFDVIEHIENDTTFMSDLLNSDFVNEDTKIFITVPAYNSLFSSHDIFLKHYRRYNNAMFRQLASDVNFHIIEKGNFFSVLIIPRILKVIKEKISTNNNYLNSGVGGWKSKKIIDKLIAFILYADYIFSKLLSSIGLPLPGLSKYIVCKKFV